VEADADFVWSLAGGPLPVKQQKRSRRPWGVPQNWRSDDTSP